MLEASLIIPAFFAGLLMFLAPCTLPVIPGYLAFISGVPAAALGDRARQKEIKGKIFLNGLFFVAGFTVIFVALGSLAGVFGALVGEHRELIGKVGGILIIFFGLMLLNLIHTPSFLRDKKIPLPTFLTLGHPSSSFLIGVLFALGWSPCIGPILGTILLLASSSATALSGAFLLLIFSLGFAVPMLLIAAFIGEASAFLSRFSLFAKAISLIGGIFLIGMGVLMFMGQYGLLITYGYQLFDFINYDHLLQYL